MNNVIYVDFKNKKRIEQVNNDNNSNDINKLNIELEELITFLENKGERNENSI